MDYHKFPNKKFEIIYADPPWQYNDKMKGHTFSLDHEYKTQSNEWLENLPVQTISEKDACLFLWVTNPFLDLGINLMQKWGFKYKTVAFCWNKITTNGKYAHNSGRWTMGNVELCLLGIKGKPNKWREKKNVKQLVIAKRTKHSKKPHVVRERIIELLGNRTRIELFAREKHDGWEVWGDESLKSVRTRFAKARIMKGLLKTPTLF